VGSARFTAEALGAVETVAERVSRLALALPPGFGAGLELVGRTDSSGTDAANRSLSDLRAEAVRSALAARGVPASIRAVGIGTSRPLPAPDAGQADRVNRSVSFEVSLQSAATAARRAP
jgi:OOP family OmpA-OmpF porin